MTKIIYTAPFEPRTIGQQIESLARLTGAPESFVCQVRNLFSGKGITLQTDASPYIAALEEAFTREESIRNSTRRARHNLSRVQSNLQKTGEHHAVRSARAARRARPERRTREVIVDGNHRSFVMPRQLDQFPMVPGPEGQQ